MYENKPVWHIEEDTAEHILIVDDYNDKNPSLTVTNGAEYVLEELYQNGLLKGKRLFYKDTSGEIDEIQYEYPCRFLKFLPGNINWRGKL